MKILNETYLNNLEDVINFLIHIMSKYKTSVMIAVHKQFIVTIDAN